MKKDISKTELTESQLEFLKRVACAAPGFLVENLSEQEAADARFLRDNHFVEFTRWGYPETKAYLLMTSQGRLWLHKHGIRARPPVPVGMENDGNAKGGG